MAKPTALSGKKRGRGNPNWGKPLPPVLASVTEFEVQVRRLRLAEQDYAASMELRHWCYRNRNRVYVPEWLLKEWGFQVEVFVA